MNDQELKPLTIKGWSPEDRPREKLLLKGISALSDAELIAILLGSGTAKMSALDVAKRVLAAANNQLHELAKFSVNDFTKLKGIGEARAVTIIAALELGRRKKDTDSEERLKIGTSSDVYDYISPDLIDIDHEEFWIVLVNRSNRIIKKLRVSVGGVAGTVADPKIIFKKAIEDLASGIILVHNHPSGNISPSQVDRDLTKKMKEAGKHLEIQVLDHIIIGGQKYFSFADEGIM
jgi:DNA repair protein RadC